MKKLDQFLIREVSEVSIEGTDGEAGFVSLMENDQMIDHRAQVFAGTGWTDRHSNDQTPRTLARDRLDGSHHGVASGKAIVDENHLAPFEPRVGLDTTIEAKSPSNFGANRTYQRLDVRFR
jgi:hypothetical protein